MKPHQWMFLKQAVKPEAPEVSTMAKQQELEGFEHPHGDKVLDSIIEDRRKASKKRKKYNDQEGLLAEQIQERMEEKGFEVYIATNLSPAIRVRLTSKKKLLIDEYDDGSSDAADDDDEGDEVESVDASEQKAKKKLAAVEA